MHLVTRRTLIILTLALLASCGDGRLSYEEFRTIASDMDAHSGDIARRQERMRELLQSYNQTVAPAKRLPLTIHAECGFDTKACALLEQRADEEEDASCARILEEMLEQQEAIAESREAMNDLLAQLPSPHTVRRGESHYALSMRYLMEQHGLTRAKADSLVSRAALSSTIVEGFHIWFVYEAGKFDTYLAQGTAHISPTLYAKVVKRQLMEKRQAVESDVAYEQLLDSLQQCGALLTSVQKATTLGM